MSKKKEQTFAEARARLDEILAEVEHEGGDVDQLAARVREAAELIRLCRDRLSAARAQVSQVVAELSAVEQSVAQDESASAEAGAEPGDDEEPIPGSHARGGKLPF